MDPLIRLHDLIHENFKYETIQLNLRVIKKTPLTAKKSNPNHLKQFIHTNIHTYTQQLF